MNDLSIPSVPNTEELSIVINLSEWAGLYALDTASFLARVCDARGGAITRYEWKSGGSSEFPNGSLNYNATTHILVLRIPSTDMLAKFTPSLIAQRGGSFVWELGFHLAVNPTNLIGVGIGAFPIENGVIV